MTKPKQYWCPACQCNYTKADAGWHNHGVKMSNRKYLTQAEALRVAHSRKMKVQKEALNEIVQIGKEQGTNYGIDVLDGAIEIAICCQYKTVCVGHVISARRIYQKGRYNPVIR